MSTQMMIYAFCRNIFRAIFVSNTVCLEGEVQKLYLIYLQYLKLLELSIFVQQQQIVCQSRKNIQYLFWLAADKVILYSILTIFLLLKHIPLYFTEDTDIQYMKYRGNIYVHFIYILQYLLLVRRSRYSIEAGGVETHTEFQQCSDIQPTEKRGYCKLSPSHFEF